MSKLTTKQADFLREILDDDGLIGYIQKKRDVIASREFLNRILQTNRYETYDADVLNEYGTYYTLYKNK